MKLVFVPLKDVFKECKGKRQFSIKKDAYRRFSSVSNEMQIGIKKIAALYVVKAGKARYIGASSMHASQFAQALKLQKQHGWAQFVSMQDHYNLIYREEEREMLPLCYQEGVAVIPWSPLARGRLTRPWGETTARLVSDEVGKNLYKESDENDAQIAERLTGVSEELGATRAQVALAWLLSKPGIAAPIIGTSREEQLDELLNAVDITLKPEQIAELETPYKPHPVVGFK